MTHMPDPAVILDLIEAFRRSKTMFAAVSLGVFEILASGPATAGDVANRLGSDLEATGRLLEACTGLGLLRREGAAFANTEAASAYLVPSSELCMNGYIQYSNDVLLPLWSHLEDAVREGSHRWGQTFGSSGPLFDSFFPTSEKMRTFIMGMHGFGVLSSPEVVRAFDLSGFRKIADLGGATGHL
ncbi:MAG: tcmN, partial [Bryobacterales bacterium]|nr:tcmN [Bryobacterales bacterium]